MVLPVSAAEEEFVFKPGENALKSKFVFANGSYAARVSKIESGIAKSSGNPKYVVGFTGTEGPAEGIEFESHMSLAENAQWKLVETLQAAGVKGRADGSYNIKEAMGKNVTLVLKQETNPDSQKTFMTIDKVMPPKKVITTGAAPTPF